jgi:predicted DNA-binding protein (MmcQ/YjbR family)
MGYAEVEKHCLSLPGATLQHSFGPAPIFKVGGKMFAIISVSDTGKPDGVWFKAGEASFEILTKIKGIAPCPYLTRSHWVAMEGLKPLKPKELKAYLTRAHALVAKSLSKKKRAALGIAEEKRDAFAA